MLFLLACVVSAFAVTPLDVYAPEYTLPLGPVSMATDDGGFGPVGARVALVVYVDFECPHCATAWKDVSSYATSHPDVRIAYKHYPISEECNPAVTAPRHENACEAARAAVCAGKEGHFADLARLLFANQGYLDAEGIAFMANQAGLDPRSFNRCFDKKSTAARVVEDAQSGIDAQIEGTPALFLRGPWGDRWVRVGSPDAAFAAIDASAAGQPIPEPLPATTPN